MKKNIYIILLCHTLYGYNDTIMFHDSIYNVPYSTTIYDNALTDPVQFDDQMNGDQDDLDVEILDDSFKNRNKNNDLINFVKNNQLQKIKTLLKNQKYNINDQDVYGRTALHYAAASNNGEIAQLLLDYKINVNSADHEGWTPLHVAADKNAFKVAEILIINNANLTIENLEGMIPFDYARNNRMKNLLVVKS